MCLVKVVNRKSLRKLLFPFEEKNKEKKIIVKLFVSEIFFFYCSLETDEPRDGY